MKMMTYLGGDIVVYVSKTVDGSVTVESTALGDDNVKALFELHQTMQSKL